MATKPSTRRRLTRRVGRVVVGVALGVVIGFVGTVAGEEPPTSSTVGAGGPGAAAADAGRSGRTVDGSETPPAGESAPAAGPDAPREARHGLGFALPGSRSGQPIRIDSDTLEFDARNDVAVFRGGVVASQDNVVMRSTVLRVIFAPTNDASGRADRLQSVVAEGEVEVQQGERLARGERAEFNDAERTVVLSGGAVLQDGPSEVRGDRVIVYLDEERSVVEGTNTRVKAILIPERKGGSGVGPERKDGVGPGAERKARSGDGTATPRSPEPPALPDTDGAAGEEP